MGRPVGSKNKVPIVPVMVPAKVWDDRGPKTVTLPIPDRKQFTDPIHYDEILAVRVLRKGPFRGLWELVRLDDQGKVKQVVTDANTRGMIISLISKSVMRIVAAM